MKLCPVSWKALAVGSAVSLVCAAGPMLATAAAQAQSSNLSVAGLTLAGADCSTPSLTQAFAGWGDSNWYTLVSGQSQGTFTGAGWTLLGGASVKPATLVDGTSTTALDLHGASIAISPPVCVASDYPTARTMIRTASGAKLVVAAVYADALAGKGVTESLLQTGVSGVVGGTAQWAPSSLLQVHPGNLPGWQVVQFVIINSSLLGDAQLYNFYVDPRMF